MMWLLTWPFRLIAGTRVVCRDGPIRSCMEVIPVGAWPEYAQVHQYDVATEPASNPLMIAWGFIWFLGED
jgi:hypothetical protein